MSFDLIISSMLNIWYSNWYKIMIYLINIIFFIINWNVNINALFFDNVNSIMIYLFKYIVKEKKRFFKFIEFDQQLLNIIKFEINYFLYSYVIKFMNKTFIKRDWFAQKIYHILLNLNFSNFFKLIQSLNFRFFEQQHRIMLF